ncbi:unnamed protein product [Ectocarpus sp. CCAP 1310/34]|nr:unnamed protein product [Ectocarpus sp. CCAP 1310/34]
MRENRRNQLLPWRGGGGGSGQLVMCGVLVLATTSRALMTSLQASSHPRSWSSSVRTHGSGRTSAKGISCLRSSAFSGSDLSATMIQGRAAGRQQQRGRYSGSGVGGLEAAVSDVFPRFKRRRKASAEENTPPLYRSVKTTMRPLRLPAWPVQNGLIYTALDFLRLRKLALHLEDLWGGRVGVLQPPNQVESDPFIMLVHHRHTFWPLDPFRPISNMFVPEGFPAHPHRGFQTVTYVMRGGMVHRDSMGLKQRYGANAVQWMSAGRGILHEEMWDIKDKWEKADMELYQIWVNLPSSLKMTRPRIQLAGEGTGSPLPVATPSKGTEVIVLCNETSPVETMQPLSMLHVKMKVGAEPWAHHVPWGHHCLIYVRRGDLTVVPTEEGYYEGDEDREPQLVPTATAVSLEDDGDYARFENRGKEDLDFMLIEAEPTRESIATRGSMVMNTEKECDKAYRDFSEGFFGVPWDNRLNDDEWREYVQGAGGKRTGYRSDER